MIWDSYFAAGPNVVSAILRGERRKTGFPALFLP